MNNDNKYLKIVLGILLTFILGCAELPITSDSQSEVAKTAVRSLLKKRDSSYPNDFSYAPLKNKKVQSYLDLLGKKLQTVSDEEINFHVLATPYIQGFTDYGGPEIYVTQGMLNTISNEAELASLLGHEIGHIALKHERTEFKDKGRLWDIIADEAENRSGLNVGLSDYRYDIAYANFNKNKEEKADEFGAELAAKKGYNPYALCDLFDRLSQNVKDGISVQIENLTGSHKSLKERAAHLRKYLAEEGYKQTKDGFFTYRYQSVLSSLISNNKNLSLTKEEQKILAEVTGYQNEIEGYRKPNRPLPRKRFTSIMGRVLDLADEHHFPRESLLLDSRYQAFMQERLIQREPLWGAFSFRLNMELAFLVSSMTFVKSIFLDPMRLSQQES